MTKILNSALGDTIGLFLLSSGSQKPHTVILMIRFPSRKVFEVTESGFLNLKSCWRKCLINDPSRFVSAKVKSLKIRVVSSNLGSSSSSNR